MTMSGPDNPPSPGLFPAGHLAHVESTYRDLTMSVFPFEIRTGHHLAFVRTFASPTVASLLARTGEMEAAPHRRGTDTGLFVYELIAAGFDSPTGWRIIKRLIGMHRKWGISNDDYVWVLGTFCVLGVQIIDRYGWRALSEDERCCLIDWYRELGTRMGVRDIPQNFDAFERWFRAYEVEHLRRTPDGDRLIAATRPVVLGPVPRPLRSAALKGAAVIVDEPARSALGLPTPGRVTTMIVGLLLRARAWRRRRRGASASAWFTPGQPSSDYPNGYTIGDLGPRG